MRAILSVTTDPLYSFLLPFAAWSWEKIGVKSIVLWPRVSDLTEQETKSMSLVFDSCSSNSIIVPIWVNDREKLATYSQVSRLYASLLEIIDEDEVLITSDCDMAVFGNYLKQGDNNRINVFGQDLVDDSQYPMCYISMTKALWKRVMGFSEDDWFFEALANKLEPLACEHMRGNYWALDQETIFNQVKKSGLPVYGYSRANKPHRFATRRADRDSWPDIASPDIIDAHLPRPGHLEENFKRIITLFEQMYPTEDFRWMRQYREEYLKLLP